jgi:uncharacterized YccA/Bax inhibitor family protein
MSDLPPTPDDAQPRSDPRDRLTILRLLALTAGVAVGITVFAPDKPGRAQDWLDLAHAVIIGLSLPAPFFILRFRRMTSAEFGPGVMFALMSSFGVLLMLPPAIVVRATPRPSSFDLSPSVTGCLYFVLPLMSLWFVLACVLTGGARRAVLGSKTPWTERYGFFLAVVWSPLGIWHTYVFYLLAFK